MSPSHRRVVSALSLTAALVPACAATQADTHKPELAQPSRTLDIQTRGLLKVYDNGLTLFMVPDKYTRLVEFDVRQHVGSREDPEGKGGMAHLVEHLMFQMPVNGEGSPRLMSDLPQHALFFNAYTAADETHYMHLGTSDELERYFQYTALRLNYDCEAVPEDEFLRERDVVRNEHRWRGQGLEAAVYDGVLEHVYPPGHPYRKSLLGGDEELASITPDDACQFIKRYYTPSQAHVVIAGDIDPEQVAVLADEYLASLPKVDAPPREDVPPVEFRQKEAKIVAPVKHPTAVILFKMPEPFAADEPAFNASIQTLFLAVSFFTSGRGSVLENWYFAPFGGKEARVLGIAVETKKARDLDRGVDEVLDAITRGFSPALQGKEYKGTYDVARQNARLQVLSQVAGITSRTGAYADYLEEGERPGFLGAELAAIEDLTDEQAQSVGRHYFNRESAMTIKVVPDGTKDKAEHERAEFDYEAKDEENLAVPDDIDPAEARRPLELQDIAPPEGQTMEYALDNGMKVVFVQSSDIPVMDVQLIVGGGRVDGGEGGTEIATMVQRFYGPDTDDRDARSLVNYFQMAGGDVGGFVGQHASVYTARGLSIYLDFLIAGLSEQVINAEYGTGALEGWKQRVRDAFKKHSAMQQREKVNRFYGELYGAGHPHVQEEVTDAKELRDITLRDVETFRRDHYRAANSTLIITGGFDMELAIGYVDQFFGSPTLRNRQNAWQDEKVTAPRKAAPPPKPGSTRVLTEADKEKVQTDITLAYPLATAYGDDHAALAVLADMLNFQVSVVRQKLGASYGVYGRLGTDRPRIEVGGAVDSAKAGPGLEAILGAVEGLGTHPDFDRLFAFSRRNVLRQMINQQADPKMLAQQLASAINAGQSVDYFQTLATRVATLTPAQVKSQIDRVLRRQRSVMMLEGPQSGIDNALVHNKIEGSVALPQVIHDEDE